MIRELGKVLHIYFFGLYFFYYGIYSILFSIRFKHGKAEKKLGEVVGTKLINKENIIQKNDNTKTVPVIKYEHNGKMYTTIGYSDIFRQTDNYNLNDQVDIYYDEIKYPKFVFIDNGFKDYVKGLVYMIISLPLVSTVF